MLDPGCAAEDLPNLGDPCKKDGLVCDYNMCAGNQDMFHQWVHGVGMECVNGHWTIWNSMMACI
jgi:hypothetical protein